jgi:HSP20 family protein
MTFKQTLLGFFITLSLSSSTGICKTSLKGVLVLNSSLMDIEKYGTTELLQELLKIHRDIEELAQSRSGEELNQPKIDLFDLGDSYRLIIDVPGVSQENLELALQNRSLVIAGLREPIEEGTRIISSERARGHFQRSIELPTEIDRDACTAHLQQGLLVLNLPKA